MFILRPLLGFFYYTRHGQRCEWRHIDCRREADMCINFLGSGFNILVVVFESLWYKGLEIGKVDSLGEQTFSWKLSTEGSLLIDSRVEPVCGLVSHESSSYIPGGHT